MELWYLVDSVTNKTGVTLRLIHESTEEVKEVQKGVFQPYFVLPHPLSRNDEQTVKNLQGEIEVIKKRDLFLGQTKKYCKVNVQANTNLRGLSRVFERVWENEIPQAQGYIYDHQLAFGAPYFVEEENLQAAPLRVSRKTISQFEEIFSDVKRDDPLKYHQLEYWFRLCLQPEPLIKHRTLGINGETVGRENSGAFMLARIANIPIPKAYESRRVSTWIKSMIFTYLKKKNILVPSSRELRRGETTKTVPGALTKTPKSGAYFNTVVCDFESLYPSCIDSYNLSYETVNCGHEECLENNAPTLEHHVCTRRRGFYSILVGALKDLRVYWFKPLQNTVSASELEGSNAGLYARLLKLISVSSFGVTVRIHGLACPPLAESITSCGRHVLQSTWDFAEERGLRPIYGDTDSIFLDDPPNEEVSGLIKKVKDTLKLKLAVEKQYSICVLSKAKKAYFGVTVEGTPDIKGLTAMKSNAPTYIRNVLLNSVQALVGVRRAEDFQASKKKIFEIVTAAIRNLEKHLVKFDDLLYTVKLYHDPNEKIAGSKALHQPYQCAMQLIDAGAKLKRGDAVSFVKVKPFNYKRRKFTVKPAAQVKSVKEINVKDYVRNLKTALNQTFEPMGVQLEAKTFKITDWM